VLFVPLRNIDCGVGVVHNVVSQAVDAGSGFDRQFHVFARVLLLPNTRIRLVFRNLVVVVVHVDGFSRPIHAMQAVPDQNGAQITAFGELDAVRQILPLELHQALTR